MTTEEVQKLRPIPDGFVRLLGFLALVGIAVVALLMTPYIQKLSGLGFALVFLAVMAPILNGPNLLRMGYPTVRLGLGAYWRRNLRGYSLIYHNIYSGSGPFVFKYCLEPWQNDGSSLVEDRTEASIIFDLGGFGGLFGLTVACRRGSPAPLAVVMTVQDVLENPDDPMVLVKDEFGNRLRLRVSQALEMIFNGQFTLTGWVKSHQHEIAKLEKELQAHGQLKSNEKELENYRHQAEQAEAERKEHQGYHARLHTLFAEALAVIPGAINMIDTSDRIKNQVEGRQLRKHLFEAWGTLLKAVVGIPDARAKDQARQANQEMIDRVFSSSR